MFTSIRFRMENSLGTPACVSLYNRDGLIDYEILFPGLGVRDSKRQSLGKSGSAKFLDRLKKSGFVYFMASFARQGAKENDGDFWDLELELEDGFDVHIHGPAVEESRLYPFIQDFAELLDQQFSITQYISSNRVDKLEISFLFNEIKADFSDYDLQYDQCDHTEMIVLDRSTFTFSYAKRFPASCFHSTYECKCEQQVRQILDQTSVALEDQRVFEDVVDIYSGRPLLQFRYTFHDGSTTKVRRSLCPECLRDQLYIEMIDVLYETSLHLQYKGGILDRRFLFPWEDKKMPAFYVVYCEEDVDDCDESEMA